SRAILQGERTDHEIRRHGRRRGFHGNVPLHNASSAGSSPRQCRCLRRRAGGGGGPRRRGGRRDPAAAGLLLRPPSPAVLSPALSATAALRLCLSALLRLCALSSLLLKIASGRVGIGPCPGHRNE